MKEQPKREQLLEAIKTAVATYGVEGASTRIISDISGVNGGHIYRFFRDRDDMLFQAYTRESGKVTSSIAESIDAVRKDNMGLGFEDQVKVVFMKMWRMLLDNRDMCKFCLYYYHSPEFEKFAGKYHEDERDMLMRKLNYLFESEEETTKCMYAVFNQIYDFANQVLEERMPDNDETAQFCFNLVMAIFYSQSKRGREIRDREKAQK